MYQYEAEDTDRYRTRSPEGQSLIRELNAYCAEGCGLKLNGRPSRPEQIVRECLRERHDYMRDLVTDNGKNIREINFVRIRTR